MIRPAQDADATAIAFIRTEAIRQLAIRAYEQPQLHAWLQAPSAGELNANTRKLTLVDEFASQLRGFAQLDLACAEIARIYVAPRHARQGVGMGLLRELEAQASRHGLDRLVIDATLNAVPFYAHAGYRVQARVVHRLAGGIDFTCMAMEKVL
ncbi:MAG TPA: GNAT family N-acetyltransferase [Ideonella sp.]|uniref:GNAT family N-acetyltransferase n=1 Tax=Ideonella sp. TaxID=1929293 RepID=UPI002C794717|nr:GNAT family N-acetyltransferase [Ideonella sp.]HSI49848.1 GNAT family N-acetyltransferase [Ideonella sp.]